MTTMKQALCLTAAVTLLAATGCSDKKSVTKDAVSDTDAAFPDDGTEGQTSEADGYFQYDTVSAIEKYQPGELLAAAAERFAGDYTYKLSVTYSDDPDTVADLIQVSRGDDFYMSVREKNSSGLAADTVYLQLGDTAYDIDYNIGAYNGTEIQSGLNLISNIIDMRLDRTSTHTPQDIEGYTVEEYTYTGDTYITVYDFYFNRYGALKKYTVTYTVEGQDEIVETAEVVSFAGNADDRYFSEDILDELTDFSALSEDERFGFCLDVCERFSITTDHMYSLSIRTDDLKRISFDMLSTLVYSYAYSQPYIEKETISDIENDTDSLEDNTDSLAE